jgi:hypothetical protein
MSGIRVDTEWLATYAGEVRAAGEEIAAVQRDLEVARLRPDSFGDFGRKAGAAEAYERLRELLVDQTRRAGEVLTGAGDELDEVVDFHAGGDDESAHHIKRKQEW